MYLGYGVVGYFQGFVRMTPLPRVTAVTADGVKVVPMANDLSKSSYRYAVLQRSDADAVQREE